MSNELKTFYSLYPFRLNTRLYRVFNPEQSE